MNDYANAGVIDPRCVFTRNDSTPSNVHYWSDEDHVSSENLLPYSENVGLWVQSGLLSRTGGQTDPAGGSTGFTLQENSSTGIHRISQNVTASGDLAFTVYAKQGSGTRYLTLALYYATANTVMAVYDLAGGSPVTATGSSSTYTSITASQTASGNGYYKCVLKATGSATVAIVNLNDVATTVGLDTNWGTKSYTGDGSSSLLVAYTGLSTVGSVDYNSTSGQIHREYAATLKSVAYSGQPRFEYEPTGDRSARGLLIEGQAQNLNTYSKNGANSSGVYQYNTSYAVATPNAAIGPDGTLSATLLTTTDAGSPTVHSSYANLTGIAGSTAHTMSVFAKAAGHDTLVIHAGAVYGAFGANIYGTFTLTGSGTASASGGTATAQIESCGNGWFRCSLTETTASSPTGMRLYYYVNSSSTYQGDDYSGLILWGFQTEAQSFASSWVDTGTSGSTSTRTADSLSVATADIGYTGGPVTLFAESSTQTPAYNSNNRGVVDLSEPASSYNRVMIYNRGAQAGGFLVNADNVQQGSGFGGITDDSYTKVGVSVDTNSIKHCVNGGTVSTDTSAVIPDGLTKMFIGQTRSGSGFGGHIKRIYLYPESTTDTELQSLTS
jgi:hypothetical protein